MADVRAVNIRSTHDAMLFDIQLSDRLMGTSETIADISFPMLGEHNVQNALAAISVALEMGIDRNIIRNALATFKGVGRRFDIKGVSHGITIIDDYGHHPVEIKAALSAGRLKANGGKLFAVVQPHRYSRLRDLFDDFCSCFNEADHVIVADVYAAGEAPLEGFGKEELVSGLQAYGHRNVQALEAPDKLAQMIAQVANDGDIIMCLGAGTITNWAADLPSQLDGELTKMTKGGLR